MSPNWQDNGLAFVYVNRRRRSGELVGAGYLVDVWGIGVKDCFRTVDARKDELDSKKSFLDAFGEEMQDCTEYLARQLVWGGRWRNREQGFRLPSQFGACAKLLPRLDAEEIDQSLFGKDGQTLIIGDYQDLARRSLRPLDPENEERDFALGFDPLDSDPEQDLNNPWEELFVEDEQDPDPGKERVLFIDGTFYGESFPVLYRALRQWKDLHTVDVDEELEQAQLDWTRPYPSDHWSPLSRMKGARQVLGQVAVNQDSLTVSVRGKSWMLCMAARLHDEFGSTLVPGSLRIRDPFDFLSARPSGRSSQTERACDLAFGDPGLCSQETVDSLSFIEPPDGFILPAKGSGFEIAYEFLEGEEAEELKRQIAEEQRRKERKAEEKRARRTEINRRIAREKKEQMKGKMQEIQPVLFDF